MTLTNQEVQRLITMAIGYAKLTENHEKENEYRELRREMINPALRPEDKWQEYKADVENTTKLFFF